MRHLCALWNDERGFIISAELVLIGTLCVLGLITGLTLVRDSIGGELGDIACAMRSLDQSYAYSGFRAYKTGRRCAGGIKAYTAGSCFNQNGEACVADIVSFGSCREVIQAPVAPAVPCPPDPVETVPSAPAQIICPPAPVVCPPAPVVCPPAPTYCPPAPTYCPQPVEICPPLYVPQQ